MDSAKNGYRKNTPPNGREWEDAAFGWDNMKEGIFDKILEEDSGFFEEKRRRLLPVWWWAGAAVLLLTGLGFWLILDGENTGSKNAPTPASSKQPLEVEAPIAKAPHQVLDKNEIAQTHKTITNIEINENVARNNAADFFGENSTPAPSPELSAQNGLTPQAKVSFISPIVHTNNSSLPSAPKPNSPSAIATLKIRPFITSQPTHKTFNILTTNDLEQDKTDGKKKGNWKLAAHGGALFSFSKYSGSSEAAALRNQNTSPYFGYQYGLEAWMPLNQKDYLMFGLNRQSVYQNIDIRAEEAFDTTLHDVILETTYYVVGDRVEPTYGDTAVTGIKRHQLVNYNEFKSVQFRAGYARIFQQKKWSVSPFVNIAAGWLTHSSGRTVAADQSIFTFNDKQRITKRFQASTQAGVTLERQLKQQFSLHFQYRFGQQWGNVSKEQGLELRPAFHYFSLGVAKRW